MTRKDAFALALTAFALIWWISLLLSDELTFRTLFGTWLLIVMQAVLLDNGELRQRRTHRQLLVSARVSEILSLSQQFLKPSTGLPRRWYFEMRLLEESTGSIGASRSMVLIVLALTKGTELDENWTTATRSAEIMLNHNSSSYLLGELGPKSLGVCLLDSTRRDAEHFLRRLMPQLEPGRWLIGLAVLPDDYCQGKELIEVAMRRLAPWRSEDH